MGSIRNELVNFSMFEKMCSSPLIFSFRRVRYVKVPTTLKKFWDLEGHALDSKND